MSEQDIKPALPQRQNCTHRAIYRVLDALAVGQTCEFATLPRGTRAPMLARTQAKTTGYAWRTFRTSRGIMFVRIE